MPNKFHVEFDEDEELDDENDDEENTDGEEITVNVGKIPGEIKEIKCKMGMVLTVKDLFEKMGGKDSEFMASLRTCTITVDGIEYKLADKITIGENVEDGSSVLAAAKIKGN